MTLLSDFFTKVKTQERKTLHNHEIYQKLLSRLNDGANSILNSINFREFAKPISKEELPDTSFIHHTHRVDAGTLIQTLIDKKNFTQTSNGFLTIHNTNTQDISMIISPNPTRFPLHKNEIQNDFSFEIEKKEFVKNLQSISPTKILEYSPQKPPTLTLTPNLFNLELPLNLGSAKAANDS
jgi:hypothetical protein